MTIYSCPDCDGDLEHEFDTLWCPKCQHTVPYPAVGDHPDD